MYFDIFTFEEVAKEVNEYVQAGALPGVDIRTGDLYYLLAFGFQKMMERIQAGDMLDQDSEMYAGVSYTLNAHYRDPHMLCFHEFEEEVEIGE